jgi:conjugative transfer region protein TrbK
MRLERMTAPQDVGFVALGILIGVVAVFAVQAGAEPDVRARSPAFWAGPICPASATDPIAEELARCRQLPLEKADDPFCRKLWAAQRRKFLGPSKAPESEDRLLDLFPTVPGTREPAAGPRAPAQKSE